MHSYYRNHLNVVHLYCILINDRVKIIRALIREWLCGVRQKPSSSSDNSISIKTGGAIFVARWVVCEDGQLLIWLKI